MRNEKRPKNDTRFDRIRPRRACQYRSSAAGAPAVPCTNTSALPSSSLSLSSTPRRNSPPPPYRAQLLPRSRQYPYPPTIPPSPSGLPARQPRPSTDDAPQGQTCCFLPLLPPPPLGQPD